MVARTHMAARKVVAGAVDSDWLGCILIALEMVHGGCRLEAYRTFYRGPTHRSRGVGDRARLAISGMAAIS